MPRWVRPGLSEVRGLSNAGEGPLLSVKHGQERTVPGGPEPLPRSASLCCLDVRAPFRSPWVGTCGSGFRSEPRWASPSGLMAPPPTALQGQMPGKRLSENPAGCCSQLGAAQGTRAPARARDPCGGLCTPSLLRQHGPGSQGRLHRVSWGQRTSGGRQSQPPSDARVPLSHPAEPHATLTGPPGPQGAPHAGEGAPTPVRCQPAALADSWRSLVKAEKSSRHEFAPELRATT